MKENGDESLSDNNNKKSNDPSSLKYDKFKGMTAEQIINRYESVLSSREKQFFELTQEIGKASHIIQKLKQKKEDYIYNNVLLKDIFSKREQQLKQELSNKEITFMKLTDIEHKFDDLQNKIEYIINKQNALADLSMREKERMNQDKEEGKTLLGKEMHEEKEKEMNKKENKKNDDNNIIIKDANYSNDSNDNINNNGDVLEKKEEKNNNIIIEDINDEKKEMKDNKNEIKDVVTEKKEKKEKENSFLLAKERLNRLKKEKNKKMQKLDLSEFLSQSNDNNNNDNDNNNNNNNSNV